MAKNKTTENIIGYLELGEDDTLEIKRRAQGRDLYFALQAQIKKQSFEAALIQSTCTRNGDRMTLDFIENLEADIAGTLEEVLIDSKQLVPISIEEFPKRYQLGEKEIALTRNRLIKDNAQAQSMANNDQAAVAFWMLSFLIQIDGKKATYDDLMEMPAGEVQALIPLVTPKKRQVLQLKM